MAKKICLEFTEPQLRALLSMAGEGFQGVTNDTETIKAFLGSPAGAIAAENALNIVRAAVYALPPSA